MHTVVLIPAYEPDEKLFALADELLAHFPLLVVDDGSGESCTDLFSRLECLGVTVLHHETNRGKGAAIKTGLSHLLNEPHVQTVVTADADGQHSVEDICRIARAMDEHPDTFLLGGRDFSQMPARSRTGNTITRFFFRLCTGLSISDTQSGLRGFPRCMWERLIALEGERYEYEMNMLLALKRWEDVSYLELPIETIYLNNNETSHFHALRDGLRVFSRVLRYTGASLGSTAVDYILYSVLLLFLPTAASYICARIVSATLNYQLCRRVVFHAPPSMKSAGGYTLLVCAVMLAGSLGVEALCSIGFHKLLAKILADSVLFVVNYMVQKKVVFKKAHA